MSRPYQSLFWIRWESNAGVAIATRRAPFEWSFPSSIGQGSIVELLETVVTAAEKRAWLKVAVPVSLKENLNSRIGTDREVLVRDMDIDNGTLSDYERALMKAFLNQRRK